MFQFALILDQSEKMEAPKDGTRMLKVQNCYLCSSLVVPLKAGTEEGWTILLDKRQIRTPKVAYFVFFVHYVGKYYDCAF